MWHENGVVRWASQNVYNTEKTCVNLYDPALWFVLCIPNCTQYSPGPSGTPEDSSSLKACQALLTEYLPKLKALPKATVTRQVCGGCLDFKVSISQPLDEHGAWAEAEYGPLEEEFMAKLKQIEGTSVHETQEITFEIL